MTSDLIPLVVPLVRQRYVYPDVAEQIADRLASVDLATDLDVTVAASRLTEVAQSVNADRHLRIRPRRAGGIVGEPADWRAHYAADAVRNAGGMQTVTRLDPGTGLLAIAPYQSPVDLAEPYVRAAFALLRGVERLVIDLRAGRGGTPETVAYICGFLLGDDPVHLQDIVDRSGYARQYWSVPAADRLPDAVTVAVLTSAETFSGCEELAYDLQALGRATVIGETTGGGAHPVEVVGLTDELEISIPVARSVNAVTGTNWEQVGVVPDLSCAAEVALERGLAHLR